MLLYIAVHHPINEVALFFNNTLYRGNRAIKTCRWFQCFFVSPNSAPLLEAGINIKTFNQNPLPKPKGEFIAHHITLNQLVVTIYPGLSDEVVKNILMQPVKALYFALLWCG